MIEDADPPRYEANISLRIWHPEARDLTAVLRDWGLEVSWSWQTGEPKRTRKGATLKGTRTNSYAFAELPLPGRGCVEAALAAVLDRLEMANADTKEFAHDGGEIELFVGWQFDGNSGATFDWQLLQRLSENRIGLSLDILPRGRTVRLRTSGWSRERAAE